MSPGTPGDLELTKFAAAAPRGGASGRSRAAGSRACAPKPGGVTVSAVFLLLVILAALRLAWAAYQRLGLDVRETLLWFGLAEVPAPPLPRRASAATRGHHRA